MAAHSVARFLNEPPEILVLAWGLSRSMTEICAQFSLAIYLMILVAGDEVFTEHLLYSFLTNPSIIFIAVLQKSENIHS